LGCYACLPHFALISFHISKNAESACIKGRVLFVRFIFASYNLIAPYGGEKNIYSLYPPFNHSLDYLPGMLEDARCTTPQEAKYIYVLPHGG